MAYETMMVLTSKSLETMISEGGSGNWKAKRDSVYRSRYIVAVRNRHSNWSEGIEEHGTAFLIGRIDGVKKSPEDEDRLVVTFGQYAILNKPNVWPEGHRNPVAYTKLEDLGIDPESLEWKEFPAKSEISNLADARVETGHEPPATVIEKAKRMIATSLSIPLSAVTISIQV
jgi:hypothetical protein